jgi:ribonuclease-3
MEGCRVESQHSERHHPAPRAEQLSVQERRSIAERSLGYQFQTPTLLERALTHASVCDARVTSNERMEFLGDAILGAIACERIYDRYPDLLEGQMTKIKSVVVSRRTCARMAKQLGLDRLLVIGKGMRGQASIPSSLNAAVLESVIAAIYIDAGYDRTRTFLAPILDPFIERAAESGHQQNYKSLLQHLSQQSCEGPPHYRILEERGPDHSKSFVIRVELGEAKYEAGSGGSKKIAEQRAALNALQAMGHLTIDDCGEVRLTNPDADDA